MSDSDYMEEEDEDAVPPVVHGGGGAAASEPLLTIQDLLGIVCGLAATHPDHVPTGNILESAEADIYYRPFVEFLIEKGYAGPDADYLDNCNYPMLVRSMPTVMQPIKDEIQTYGDDMDPRFFSECVIAAFTCCDGTLACGNHRRNENGEVRYRPVVQTLSISGADHPFKQWLKQHGFWVGKQWVCRVITPKLLRQIPFVYACNLLLSYKKICWKVVEKLAPATRIGAFSTVHLPLARIAMTTQLVVMSWLNSLHGVMLSEEWFRDDFQQMARKRCVFDLFMAGIMGSDGGIYQEYEIYQSNRRWCRALAHTMQHVYGLETQPRVSPIRASAGGIRWRPSTSIRISRRDSERIAPRVAAFDMNRKDQHIIYLLRRLITNSRDFPNKTRVQAFLEATAKFIRKSRPS